MRQIEYYYPKRTDVPVQQSDGPHVMAFQITREDISNLCKSKLNEKDKEVFDKKEYTFYPIQIYQNKDLSFDIICGVLI